MWQIKSRESGPPQGFFLLKISFSCDCYCPWGQVPGVCKVQETILVIAATIASRGEMHYGIPSYSESTQVRPDANLTNSGMHPWSRTVFGSYSNIETGFGRRRLIKLCLCYHVSTYCTWNHRCGVRPVGFQGCLCRERMCVPRWL